jgi:hypothetical protein
MGNMTHGIERYEKNTMEAQQFASHQHTLRLRINVSSWAGTKLGREIMARRRGSWDAMGPAGKTVRQGDKASSWEERLGRLDGESMERQEMREWRDRVTFDGLTSMHG